jgi:hypothetical protein
MKRNGGWRISGAEKMKMKRYKGQTADDDHRRQKVSIHEEELVRTVKQISLKPIYPVLLHLDTHHRESHFLPQSPVPRVLSIALYQICPLCPRATNSCLVT